MEWSRKSGYVSEGQFLLLPPVSRRVSLCPMFIMRTRGVRQSWRVSVRGETSGGHNTSGATPDQAGLTGGGSVNVKDLSL